jgi:hypothetical protein
MPQMASEDGASNNALRANSILQYQASRIPQQAHWLSHDGSTSRRDRDLYRKWTLRRVLVTWLRRAGLLLGGECHAALGRVHYHVKLRNRPSAADVLARSNRCG